MAKLRIMGIGACQVHNVIYDLHNRNIARGTWMEIPVGETLYTHSVEEAIQMMAFCRGELDIPKEVMPLCYTAENFDPDTGNGAAVDDADVTFIQFDSPLEIKYGPYRINRNEIARRIFPLGRGFSELSALYNNRWYNALIKGNDAVRQQNSELLLELLPNSSELHWLRAAYANITSVKFTQQELTEGLDRLAKLLKNPLGVITPVLRYTEDGRGFAWPPEFVDQVICAAKTLDLPLLDYSAIVEKYGVDVAIGEHMSHWKKDFIPVVGEIFMDFAARILAHEKARQATILENIQIV